MTFNANILQVVILAMIALSIGGFILAIFLPFIAPDRAKSRMKSLAGSPKAAEAQSGPAAGRPAEVSRENRRKQVQESLRLAEAREKQSRKRLTLRMLISQAGLDLSLPAFWGISAAAGAFMMAASYLLFGLPWYASVLAGIAGLLGMPRWYLGMLRTRRQEKFLVELPDALDIIVRGLRSGLPLSDAIKVIAAESPPPVGPEFWEVSEGQRVGISIEQGVERMYERMPLKEVSFLAIVLSIQSKTGGNLTEALSNLAKVLRDRRKMKSKIKSVSQEAKSSATILGSLPFIVAGALYFLDPEYLVPLWTTFPGKIVLGVCAVFMLTGTLMMRKMINFEI